MLAIERQDEVTKLRAIIAEKDAVIASQARIIEAQEKRIVELELTLQTMRHQLDNLVRQQFGQRSEKDSSGAGDDNALTASDDVLDDEPPDDIEFETITYERRKRKNRQARLPDSLPRVDVHYDVSIADKTCSCGCGRKLRQMGTVITEEIVVVPELIYVRRHLRPKYGGCYYDSTIITAPMLPAPIKKGLASAEMIAMIAINKFEDHLPLYRQEQRFTRHGVDLSRQTMCDWLSAGAKLIAPVVALIRQYTLANPIIHTDDTPISTLAPGTKKTKTARLWVYAGRGGDEADGQFSYIFYEYSPNREAQWPQAILSGYDGYIQADAYPGYDILYRDEKANERLTTRPGKDEPIVGKALEVACWMHARREFYKIAKNNKKRGLAYEMVQHIKKLYKIEVDAKESGMNAKQRYELRQAQSLPILDEMKTWLDEKKNQIIPKTPIAEAFTYALNQWTALCRYVEDGRLEIDNGYAERLIKGPCIGKKNFLFFGSDNGGNNASGFYTLIESAKLHKLNTKTYLIDVIRRLSAGLYHNLEDLLPHRWQPFNPFDLKGISVDDPMIVEQLVALLPSTAPEG